MNSTVEGTDERWCWNARTPNQTHEATYDAEGRMSQIIRPEGVTTFRYNRDGEVKNLVSSEG